ncbi:hypothetical protein [Aliikangiella coralliicola]|uniref:Uncharacterized protein n=1 Tax=Aliikangiella coralliicola TaxID=2592383 RepID=A0A545U066_9GAMM|nr:hypothetical protein [Aliikangiella coralliicola]TQV82862.1 hypothetical protein FLL46_24135 [Aliikangiella coralliicola]
MVKVKRLPAIPAVGGSVPKSLHPILNAIRSNLNQMNGQVGNDPLVSLSELTNRLSLINDNDSSSNISSVNFFEDWSSRSSKDWHEYLGDTNISFPQNGEVGGHVLNASGYTWRIHKDLIPYNAEWIYRVSCRIRRTVAATDPLKERVFAGITGVSSDGRTLINVNGTDTFSSQHYAATSGFDMSQVPIGEWQTFNGWFSGYGVFTSNTETNPTPLTAGIAYIRPTFILNYNGGDGEMECDFFSIESVSRGAIGADGVDGKSVAQLTIYRRAASQPATPVGGSYNFNTDIIGAPTNWSASIPPGTDPLYASVGIASIDGTDGTDTTITWGLPDILAQNGLDGSNGFNGIDGTNGTSVYLARVFKRQASAPATPPDNSATYNFSTNTLTPPSGWSDTIPAGTDPLYATEATFAAPGATGTDSTQTWTTPVIFTQDGDDGNDGVNGQSTYLFSIYRRASSAPTTPVGGSFNFGTNVPIAPAGWSVSPQAGTDPLYVSTTLASVSGDTGTDSTLTWSVPEILVRDGADGLDGATGSDGKSVAQLTVYRRAASSPGTPSGGNYDFGTDSITAPANWSPSIPAGTDPLYASVGIASIIGLSGVDNSIVWGAPDILAQNGEDGADGSNGTNGTNGTNGLSVYQGSVYRRASTAPATPANNSGSYNFGTNTLTPPPGWSSSVPAGSDPLYVSDASFSIQGTTGTDSIQTWTTPTIAAQDGQDGQNGNNGNDGADGTNGLSTYQFSVYRRSSFAPSTPVGGSFNFGTNTPTAPSSWFTSVPSGDDPLWVSQALASVSGDTGTDSTLSWTVPTIMAQNGSGTSDFVNMPSQFSSEAIGALPQTATIKFKRDGTIELDGGPNSNWNAGAPQTTLGDNYDVRCSQMISGSWDIQAAAVGTWVALSSDRSWMVLRTLMEGAGSDTASGIFQIRRSGETTILDSSTGIGEAADA